MIRLIASKTQRYIDDMTQLIDDRFNDAVWFFVIGWAIDSGILPLQNWWWYATWTHPRKLTVDAGREEQQNRANVEMGLKNARKKAIPNAAWTSRTKCAQEPTTQGHYALGGNSRQRANTALYALQGKRNSGYRK